MEREGIRQRSGRKTDNSLANRTTQSSSTPPDSDDQQQSEGQRQNCEGFTHSILARYPIRLFSNCHPNLLAFILLITLSLIHLISLFVFSKGFLLNRSTLSNHSSPVCTSSQTSKLTSLLPHQCILEPTHSKAIIILIDALRYDFVIPTDTNGHSEHRLSLPFNLTSARPHHSRLYHFQADPPTTTLQRLKALTTGTLPTFIDLSSNFASTNLAIDEDSWINQLSLIGKPIGFVGDDTWSKLFGIRPSTSPSALAHEGLFDEHITFPYQSFNVEDLDSVDEAVERETYNLLGIPPPGSDIDQQTKPPKIKDFGLFIGHLLGLDHAGHRFGASHPMIGSKLSQYDQFLQQIVSNLDDDTLLVVMGDHGMDSKGDHGGDSFLEVSSALWMYSKARPLIDFDQEIPDYLLPPSAFLHFNDGSKHMTGIRTVPQIDFVPTLSLLLGIPIPFSNLGMVIPELFFRSTLDPDSTINRARRANILSPIETMLRSQEINSIQLSNFIEAYAGSADGKGQDLAPFVPELRELYIRAQSLSSVKRSNYEERFRAHNLFGQKLLDRSRSIWARFIPSLMSIGILIMALSLAVSMKFLKCFRFTTTEGEKAPTRSLLGAGYLVGILGTALSLIVYRCKMFEFISLVNHLLIGLGIGLCLGIITYPIDTLSLGQTEANYQLRGWTYRLLGLAPLIMHSLSLASNSYTIWEDQVVVYLLSFSVVLPTIIRAFAAPQKRLRNRLILFSSLFAVCIRLIAYSTVCREEQGEACRVTFYSGSAGSPNWVMSILIPIAICLPIGLAWFLGISDSYRGPASFYFGSGLRLSLLVGVQYWISDYLISQTDLISKNPGLSLTGNRIKTLVARIDIGLCLFGMVFLWFILPLCIDIEREKEEEEEETVNRGGPERKPKIFVIGFANAYGSSYLMYLSGAFGILFLVNQPMGELTISVGLIAIMCLVEINDSLNDIRVSQQLSRLTIDEVATGIKRSRTSTEDARRPTADFMMISAFGLLSHLIFFGTGHQASFVSIQWKTGFIGLKEAHQFWSMILIGLNTFGGFILISLSIPLLTCWNLSPKIGQKNWMISETIEIGIKLMNYMSSLSLSSMIVCWKLKRHLMVWKIFGPRFMLSGLILVIVDFFLSFLSIGWGLSLVGFKVKRAFGTRSF